MIDDERIGGAMRLYEAQSVVWRNASAFLQSTQFTRGWRLLAGRRRRRSAIRSSKRTTPMWGPSVGIFRGQGPSFAGISALVARCANGLRLARGRFAGRPLYWLRADAVVVACSRLLPLAIAAGRHVQLNLDHVLSPFDPIFSLLAPRCRSRVLKGSGRIRWWISTSRGACRLTSDPCT